MTEITVTTADPLGGNVPRPGFRIRTELTRLDPGLRQQFAEFSTPDISDLLNH